MMIPRFPLWLAPGRWLPPAARVPVVAGHSAHGEDLQHRLNEHYNTVMYSPLVDEYYDFSGFHNYGYWTPLTRTQKEASEKLVDLLIGFLPQRRGHILDVACGMGATTRRLLRRYPASLITGINISEQQLATCRQRAPGCRFLEMDATHMRFPDESFENILCVEAAFHFETREKFLREALRVLKPGGGLALSDILVRSGPQAALTKSIPAANCIADVEHYRALLARVGFENIHIIEAREQCWERFRSHCTEFVRAKVLRGEAGYPFLVQTVKAFRWREWLYTNYLLVSARKPRRGSRRRERT